MSTTAATAVVRAHTHQPKTRAEKYGGKIICISNKWRLHLKSCCNGSSE